MKGRDKYTIIHCDRDCDMIVYFFIPKLRLKCVEQFTDDARKLVSGHFRGQDMSADIMKKICKQPKIQGKQGKV